jgi:hypothetical protein
MRIEQAAVREQYTFQDVRELTLRAAGFFAHTAGSPDHVLFSSNMPIRNARFGILKPDTE